MEIKLLSKYPTNDDILKIVENDSRYYYRTIKREFPDFYSSLISKDVSFSENLYIWLYNSGNTITCSCGGKLGFQSIKLGYFKYCSPACAANNADVKEKKHTTHTERYGENNPAIKEKFYKTMQARYGVSHALQNDKLNKKRLVSYKKNDIETIKQKTYETNMERYGVKHPAQNEKILSKQIETNLKRYNIDTLLRDRNVIDKTIAKKRLRFMSDIHERVKQSQPFFDTFVGVNNEGNRILYKWLCNKCNNEYMGHLDDGTEPRCLYCYPIDVSFGQSQIQEYLKSIGINFVVNDRRLIRPLELDIVIPEHHIAIEYNGLWYHNDFKIDKNYHLNKLLKCNEIGYRLIQIFEPEWFLKNDIVKSRLCSILNKNAKIHARKTSIKSLSYEESSYFMEKNHLQGSCVHSFRIGLMYDEQLVAAMTFGKSRFNKEYGYELLRYSNKIGHSVVGGASKLLSHFKREMNNPSIITYSDRRWNTGRMYEAIGFSYNHSSTPNYYYSKDRKQLLSRQKFQKHKLKEILSNYNPAITEAENMYNNGYIRIWDCGNDVYTLENSN